MLPCKMKFTLGTKIYIRIFRIDRSGHFMFLDLSLGENFRETFDSYSTVNILVKSTVKSKNLTLFDSLQANKFVMI